MRLFPQRDEACCLLISNGVNLFHEIRNQKPHVRFALFLLSCFLVISAIGMVWLSSVRKELVTAVNDDPAVQEEFQDRLPNPVAAIGKFMGTLAASVGSLVGINGNAGFDRSDRNEDVSGGAHLLPISN